MLPAPPSIVTANTAPKSFGVTLPASKRATESNMSKDSDRISELNSKVSTFGSKTPTDSQNARDIAHAMRVANDEIRGVKGTVTNP